MRATAPSTAVTRAEVLWRVHRGGPGPNASWPNCSKCTPRNVTGLVDALEGLGLVERQPHPDDRRAVRVALTPTGDRTVAGWSAAYRTAAAELFEGIPDDELATFRSVLDVIIGRLRTPDEGE